MLQFKVNGELLDTISDEVSLEFFSSAFQDDEFQSDFSWNINFPLTPKNKRLTNIEKNPLVIQSFEDIEGQMILFAIELPFRMIIQRIKEEIETSVLINIGSFKTLQKKLVELDLTFPAYSFPGDADTMPGKIYPEVPFQLPMFKNYEFYGEENSNFGLNGQINAWNLSNNEFLRNRIIGGSGILYNDNVCLPQPFVMWILEKGFQEMGYKIDGSFYKDDAMRRLLLYSNLSIEKPEDGGVNAKITGPGDSVNMVNLAAFKLNFNNNYGTNFDIVNDEYTVPSANTFKIEGGFTIGWDDEIYVAPKNVRVQFIVTGGNTYEHQITPTSIGVTAGRIEFVTNITFAAGDVGNPMHIAIQAANNDPAAVSDYDFSIDRLLGDVINGFGNFSGWSENGTYPLNREFEGGTGLPDMTFLELLGNLQKPPFNLSVSLDNFNKTAWLNFRDDLRSTSRKPLKLLDLINDPSIEKETKMRFGISYREPDDDQYFDDFPPEFIKKFVLIDENGKSIFSTEQKLDDVEKIEQELVPLIRDELFYWQVRIDQPGLSTMYKSGGKDPDPRIMYYQGVVNGLPVATCKWPGSSGVSLDIIEDDSLFDRTSLDWFNWKANSKKLTLQAIIKPEVISNLDQETFQANVLIETIYGYLIPESITIDVDDNSISEFEVKGRLL